MTNNAAIEGRILGLDIGGKRIGVALSDPEGILATPLMVIKRRQPAYDLEAIEELIRQHEVVCVVAGLPISLDGSLGQQAKRVQDFINLLSESISVPVETWDERLSTVAVGRMLSEAGVKRGKQKGG